MRCGRLIIFKEIARRAASIVANLPTTGNQIPEPESFSPLQLVVLGEHYGRSLWRRACVFSTLPRNSTMRYVRLGLPAISVAETSASA